MSKLISWLLTCVVVVTAALAACSPSPPAVEEGDVIFQTSRSSQSAAIQLATHSRYSHMGIIFLRNGEPYVLEASATVRYTPLAKWIGRGLNGAFVLKRTHVPLTAAQIERLRSIAREFEGRPYDLTFEWSDSRIYCSELVWKIYDRATGIHVGDLQKLRDFDLSSPAVRAKMKERYGNSFPIDEPVISPEAMFESPVLDVVARVGI